MPGKGLLHAGEIRVMEMKRMSGRCEPFARPRQIVRVHVEGDEQPLGADAREDLGAMPGPADRAIDDAHARLQIESLQDLLKQHGAMFALRRTAALAGSWHKFTARSLTLIGK